MYLSFFHGARVHSAYHWQNSLAAGALERTIAFLIDKRAIAVPPLVYKCVTLVSGVICDVKRAVYLVAQSLFAVYTEYTVKFRETECNAPAAAANVATLTAFAGKILVIIGNDKFFFRKKDLFSEKISRKYYISIKSQMSRVFLHTIEIFFKKRYYMCTII